MKFNWHLLCLLSSTILLTSPAYPAEVPESADSYCSDGLCVTIDYEKDKELRDGSSDKHNRFSERKPLQHLEVHKTHSANWDDSDTCPPFYFVDTFGQSPLSSNISLQHLAFGCNKISEVLRPRIASIPSAPPPERYIIQTKSKGMAAKRWKLCRNFKDAYNSSVLQGVSFQMDDFKGFGYFPTKINYLCGNPVKEWVMTGREDSIQLICQYGTAICSLQPQWGIFGKESIITNVRIGCCELPPENWADTVGKPENETIYNSIFNLQARHPPFVFFDVDSSNSSNVTKRYNSYFTNGSLDKEKDWISHNCSVGKYFGQNFTVSNPKSTYFDGRRILSIKFHCVEPVNATMNDIGISPTDVLGSSGYTVSDPAQSLKQVCPQGLYTKATLNYFVDAARPYLVQGWSFGMACEHLEVSSVNFTSFGLVNQTGQGQESADVNCLPNWALCGVMNKVTNGEDFGTLEGVYYKFICCPLPGALTQPLPPLDPARIPIVEERV